MSLLGNLRGLFGGDAARVAEALRLEADSFAKQDVSFKASELLKEHARPAIGGILSPHRAGQADALTPDRLASILKRAREGDIEALLTLAEEMEAREPHYRSVLNTRKMAVSGAPLHVNAASDSAHDKAIADHVEQVLMRPEVEGLVLDLMDAVAKSFSCIEIIWQRDSKTWEPVGYEHREQRHFVFDRDTMRTPMLRALDAPDGVPLMPFKWLVHMPKLASGVPIITGLACPVSLCYAAKKYATSDWLAFLDVFGMPVRVGRYPASMAARKGELLRAVRSIGSDAAAVIPQEMNIEFIQAQGSGSGNTIFQQTAEYFDKQISKVVLGQTMSSDDGSSLAQSKTHERVRFDIKKADGRAVAATISRDLIKPFVLLNYGPQPAYPTCTLQTEEPEDRTALIGAVKVFVELGGEVEMSTIRDKMGFAEPAPGAKLLKPAAVVAAEMAPKPEPAEDTGEPGKGTPGAKGGGADKAADDDDDLGKDAGGKGAELNAAVAGLGERFSALEQTVRHAFDVVDDQSRAALDDWRQLDGVVVAALAAIEAAETFDDAQSVIDRLKADEGDALDIEPLTRALAMRTFTVRGVGDATDKLEV